jgi:charged multivesicular body protein 5
MDQRVKVIQAKCDECNVQLNEIKKQMAAAKGTRLNSLKQKAL